MNIFYVHYCPYEAAMSMCDKHVVKMVLETAQLLTTCHHAFNNPEPYKPTHINHPCSVWVRSSYHNYTWLFRHFEGLLQEYTYRYGKTHACNSLTKVLRQPPLGIPLDTPFTHPPKCMPVTYHHLDTISAYRAYYLNEKKPLLKYTRRLRPTWASSY